MSGEVLRYWNEATHSPILATGDNEGLFISSNSPSSSAGSTYQASIIFTRTADATPYIAGDVYGTKMELVGFGEASKGFVLTGINGVSSLATLPTGMGSFRLFLFGSQPAAIADNAAFTLASSSLTPKGILLDTLAIVINSTAAHLQTDQINFIDKRGAGTLWAYLVTQAGFTPAGATADTLTLKVKGLAA